MKIAILIVTTIFLTLSTGVFAQDPANTADQGHPFVKQLEAQYDRFRKAGQAGDIEGWLKTRTAKFAKQIKSMKPPATPEMLKKGSAQDSDLKEFKFVRVDTSKNSARMIYQKSDKDIATWVVIMFHNEDGEWKIGHSTEQICSGDLAKDATTCEKDVLSNPRLQILAH